MSAKFECCCCFGDYQVSELVSCNYGHSMCKSCVKQGININIANLKQIKCFHQSNHADDFLTIDIINNAVGPALTEKYDSMLLQKALNDAGSVYRCKYCPNAAIIDPLDTEFFCLPCNRIFCLKCDKDAHFGQLCNNDVHQEAENLTNEFTIACKCGLRIQRYDGCNKLTCRCGTKYCWICKALINDYNHFNGACVLYGEPTNANMLRYDERLRINRETEQRRISAENRRIEQERIENLRLEREREILDQQLRAAFKLKQAEEAERARLEEERIKNIRLAERRRIFDEIHNAEQKIRKEYKSNMQCIKFETKQIHAAYKIELKRVQSEAKQKFSEFVVEKYQEKHKKTREERRGKKEIFECYL